MRLWEKAKSLGVWDPGAIDLTKDRNDWLALGGAERDRVLQLCALFQTGEAAVTLDLLPLVRVVTAEGRLEESIYLTSFLWEEAKHLDFFQRFFTEVAGEPGDLSRYHHPSFTRLVDEELPRAMQRLDLDPSPEAQVRASVTYNLVIEGVMAEGGYYLFRRMLAGRGLMPGMQRAARLLLCDESRHIAFGVYFLGRLIAEHGDRAYKAFLGRMGELKPLVEESTRQFMHFFTGEHVFGVRTQELMRFSQQRFAARVRLILRARALGPRHPRGPA
jgi:ribonucleoside-diphosphate reductase beta chain